MKTATRRTVLRGTGLASVLFLSGCNGTDSDGNGDEENGNGNGNGNGTETGTGNGGDISGDDYPAIDEWLTETDVGDADSTYDGTLVDQTDQETITVDVGAEGNDGFYAFAPSAVVVSTGTEIRWDWTGEGETHNVEAEPDEQLELSDYEFSSGEAVETTGVQFTQTLDEAGVALYHCEPHLALGMKGGIAVE